MKKHIIFDFDDTISSAYEHNQQLFVDTFLQHSPDIDQEYVRMVHFTKRGTSMESQFKKVITKFKLKLDPKKLVEENELLHQKKSGNIKLFNGFEEILLHFKRMGKIISLCTNRAEGSLRLILKKNKLEKYFDNVISCKDRGHEKPDPFCLNELLKKYKDIKKSEVIYFGDSETDALFAQNAGVDYLVIDHYLNKKQFYSLILDSFVGGEDELLVEVDENNREIGSIYKMEALNNPSRFHRSVHVVVFNSKGQLVLQKRTANKLFEPGTWDVAGGWNTYRLKPREVARNELREEYGINSKISFVKKIFRKDWGAFIYLYYCIDDGPYNFNTNEVDEIKKFSVRKLLNKNYHKKIKISPHVYDYVKELEYLIKKFKIQN